MARWLQPGKIAVQGAMRVQDAARCSFHVRAVQEHGRRAAIGRDGAEIVAGALHLLPQAQGAGAGTVGAEQEAERRKPLADRGQRRQPRRVGDEGRATRLAQTVGEGVGRQGPGERHGDASEAQRRERGEQRLRSPRQQRADALATTDASSVQHMREPGCIGAECVEGDALDSAVALQMDQRGASGTIGQAVGAGSGDADGAR